MSSPSRHFTPLSPLRHRSGGQTLRTYGPDRSTSFTMPCWYCGAEDGRDADHARGCPSLPAVPDDKVFARQRTVAAAWRGRG